jgi:ankyrin repeat protein
MLAQSAAHDDTDDSVASDSSSDAAAAQAPQQRNDRFLVAATQGDLATLNRLLDEGVNPNYVNERGFNGLFMAVHQNHADCVARLLEVGANPNHYANVVSTLPLAHAALNGNADIIRLLLAGGSCVRTRAPVHVRGHL